MANFKKGDAVIQVVQPITGVVDGFQVDQESGALQVLVTYTDAAGEAHQRYFKADDLAPAASN